MELKSYDVIVDSANSPDLHFDVVQGESEQDVKEKFERTGVNTDTITILGLHNTEDTFVLDTSRNLQELLVGYENDDG